MLESVADEQCKLITAGRKFLSLQNRDDQKMKNESLFCKIELILIMAVFSTCFGLSDLILNTLIIPFGIMGEMCRRLGAVLISFVLLSSFCKSNNVTVVTL